MDRVLFYGTGGLAYGGQSLHSAGTSAAKTTIGWTVGAGVEFAVWQNLSAKIEYKYVDLGRTTLSPAALGPTRVGFRGNILTAGINYKFW